MPKTSSASCTTLAMALKKTKQGINHWEQAATKGHAKAYWDIATPWNRDEDEEPSARGKVKRLGV